MDALTPPSTICPRNVVNSYIPAAIASRFMKMDFYTLYLYFYFTHSTLQEILFEIQKIENIGIKKKLLLTILFSNVKKMSPFLPCQNKILAFKKNQCTKCSQFTDIQIYRDALLLNWFIQR